MYLGNYGVTKPSNSFIDLCRYRFFFSIVLNVFYFVGRKSTKKKKCRPAVIAVFLLPSLLVNGVLTYLCKYPHILQELLRCIQYQSHLATYIFYFTVLTFADFIDDKNMLLHCEPVTNCSISGKSFICLCSNVICYSTDNFLKSLEHDI